MSSTFPILNHFFQESCRKIVMKCVYTIAFLHNQRIYDSISCYQTRGPEYDFEQETWISVLSNRLEIMVIHFVVISFWLQEVRNPRNEVSIKSIIISNLESMQLATWKWVWRLLVYLFAVDYNLRGCNFTFSLSYVFH